jgi:hypothetical protein
MESTSLSPRNFRWDRAEYNQVVYAVKGPSVQSWTVKFEALLSDNTKLIATMPVTQFAFKEKYQYQNGFNSYHE